LASKSAGAFLAGRKYGWLYTGFKFLFAFCAGVGLGVFISILILVYRFVSGLLLKVW
jgi:hypothetical protein